jgi:lysophospholipase L1-like esterase
MRKALLYISIFIAICIIVGVAYSFYRYYAPPKLRQPYQTGATPDDTLRIAFIGDSWAFMHKDHDCVIAQMLQDSLHRPVKVHSYGVCGLTSKEIYENIFDNRDFKLFLSKRRYEFCYISAGINDTYKKMGISYYQQSMDGIIQFLLSNHIHPIIQEIPNHDINMSFERQKTSRKLLRRLSMMINDTPLDCKQLFRDALDELIREKNYANKVSIIRYQSWNNNGDKDLEKLYRSDRLHLNDNGYAILERAITKEILNQITTDHNTESQMESDADRRK